MAIPAKKLGAFMAAQDVDTDDMDLETEAEEMDEGEEAEVGEDEAAELEDFLKLLIEHGAQLETAAHAVQLFGGEAELDEDTVDQLAASVADLPDELKAGMAKFFAGLSMDDLHELLEQLEEVDAIENDAVVVPFIYHASRMLAAQ